MSAEDRGFIVAPMERVHAGKTELDLFGRLSTGETFVAVERRKSPSFMVREADLAGALRLVESSRNQISVVACQLRTMDGEPTVRLEVARTSSAGRLRDELHRAGVRTYEADVKLASLFLMDAGIHGSVEIRGSWRKGRRVSRIYEDPELAPAQIDVALSVLSIDIETDPRGQTVYAVSLVFQDPATDRSAEEVLFNGSGASQARCFPNEGEMLRELRVRIIDLDPDIITGWNLVDFDFRVLARRFSGLGIPFDIGRSDAPATHLDREDGDGVVRWKRSRAIVPGRQVVDGLWLVRVSGMGLEDYRLETVAQSVLGRGKLMEQRAEETRTGAIDRLYREEPDALCAYCLEDARLVRDILSKEGLLDLAIQKSLLIGTPLEQTWMSVASFEFLYMEHLHRRGFAAPTLGIDQGALGATPGGGIITPRAGLFRNVLSFDFKSLYPSLIRTFNIDPMTYASSALRDGSLIEAPNGARFRREPGILPEILNRFFESREKAKKAGNQRASYAYKIVMNSFYGVLGTSGCRFSSSALAGAITTLGQSILFWTRDLVSSIGYEVIYGDTDSLFVLAGGDGQAQQLSAHGERIAEQVNQRLAEHLREKYGVESRLELEFEGVYLRFFLPPMRAATGASRAGESSRGGAAPVLGAPALDEDVEARGRAKGYAGLRQDGSIEVKGMEAIRHDWTPLAQRLQLSLLEWVFHDVPTATIEESIRAIIRDLKAGKRDGDLTYRKYLRKPVEAYTKSSPPHARAAALLPPEERSGLIRYVWTRDGPQPESRRTSPFDYTHYMQKQVLPIVEAVAPYIGLDAEALLSAGGQLGLF